MQSFTLSPPPTLGVHRTLCRGQESKVVNSQTQKLGRRTPGLVHRNSFLLILPYIIPIPVW